MRADRNIDLTNLTRLGCPVCRWTRSHIQARSSALPPHVALDARQPGNDRRQRHPRRWRLHLVAQADFNGCWNLRIGGGDPRTNRDAMIGLPVLSARRPSLVEEAVLLPSETPHCGSVSSFRPKPQVIDMSRGRLAKSANQLCSVAVLLQPSWQKEAAPVIRRGLSCCNNR